MYGVYKQAIYNREGKVEFFEVFLQDVRTGMYPESMDPLKATSMVIDTLVDLDPKNVGKGRLIFINVPAIFLEASMFDLLSPKYVGIELKENANLNNNVYNAINQLQKKGFSFCIDDFGFERIDYLPLLTKCQFVKIDIKNVNYDEEELREVVKSLKDLGKKVIAKKMETQNEYQKVFDMGFDYFQGFYLSRPTRVFNTHSITSIKATLIKLYKAIKEENMKMIIDVIEKDAGATYKLLKFVNSAYFPRVKETSDVGEAVAYLGFENIVKFVILMALSDVFTEESDIKNWKWALFRAVLMEKLSQIYQPSLKGKAYLTGLFSLSMEMFGLHPEDVAKELGLDKEIVEAYEGKPNELRFLLSLVYLLEDKPTEDIYIKVANRVNSTPKAIKNILEEAKKEAEELLNYVS